MRELLESAERLLDAGDVEQAMFALIEAWRTAPSDRIGGIVERLSARLPPQEPFTARTVAEKKAAWLALAERHDPKDLPRLLSLDWPVHPRDAKERYAALRQFPADPRIVRSFEVLRASGRYDSNAGMTFWRFVFKLLYSWRYPRTHELFANIRPDSIEELRFEELLAKPKIAAPELAPEATLVLDALEARLGVSKKVDVDRKVQRAALLDAVYESPDDDAPRLVFADFLAEQGDPRGELIQLDIRLAHEGKLPGKLLKRRNELARAGGRSFCEGIHPNLEDIELRRGFASKAHTGQRFDASARAHRTLEWILLLMFGDDDGDPILPVPLHPNLVSVKKLTNVPPSMLTSLITRGDGRVFDQIWLSAGGFWSQLRTVDECQLRVRELVMDDRSTLLPLLKRGVLAKASVERLRLHQSSVAELRDLAPILSDLPGSIVEVQTSRYNAGWELAFRRRGARWDASASWLNPSPADRAPLDKALAGLPMIGDLNVVE